MSKPRSLSQLAMEKRRLAHEDRRYKPLAALAPMFDRQADELLKLNHPPDVGPGGEVVNEQTYGLPHKRNVIRNTLLEGANRIAEDASIRRTDLLLQPSFRVLEMGIDAADSVKAENSLEKMLCHQMALAHEASMRLMDRALAYEARNEGMNAAQSVEACRLANTAARLMSTYQDAMLTLQKMRSGGNQTVTVQHVNVQSGAQAVIGNVRTGGRKRRGVDRKKG